MTMPLLISHRGNLGFWPDDPLRENHPDYVERGFVFRFQCEIDVWRVGETWKLGHDKPEHEVSTEWLHKYHNLLWCHAKNKEALASLRGMGIMECFWHQTDDYTLTYPSGYLWTYPGKPLVPELSIAVLPESKEASVWTLTELNSCFGICSDKIYDVTMGIVR